MSWLARSIANSLLIDDDDNTDANNFRRQSPPSIASQNDHDNNVIREEFNGAKDDLSEFKESLTRQLWGVANFLAPPPSTQPSSHVVNSATKSHDRRFVPALNRIESTDPSISGDEGDESSINSRNSILDSGIKGLNEGKLGEFKPKLSFNGLRLQNVEENDEDEDDEEEDDDWINEAVGLTEEVLTFAGNIAHHPETWLDFPVEDDEDVEDFPMSESQKRHAQAIEHLTPRLAALRIELCPAHMSVGFFWKVYFVLLHSRLNKRDAELLSTPEVVEARAKWMQEQQKRSKKDSEWFHTGLFSRGSADFDDEGTPRSFQNEHSETFSSWTFASEPATSSTTVDSDVEKHGTEPQFIDKSILVEKSLPDSDDKKSLGAPISMKPVLSFVVDDDDDDGDDWPEDDFLGHNDRPIPVGIEDEVSFSDLEDDDCCIPVVSKPK